MQQFRFPPCLHSRYLCFMPNRPLPSLLLLAGTMWLSGCAYNVESELYPTEVPCDTTDINFYPDVMPIVEDRCVGCHSGGAPAAGLGLTTFEEVQAIGLNGMLLDRVNRSDMDEMLMPPDGPLTDCNLRILAAWVNRGCPEYN